MDPDRSWMHPTPVRPAGNKWLAAVRRPAEQGLGGLRTSRCVSCTGRLDRPVGLGPQVASMAKREVRVDLRPEVSVGVVLLHFW